MTYYLYFLISFEVSVMAIFHRNTLEVEKVTFQGLTVEEIYSRYVDIKAG